MDHHFRLWSNGQMEWLRRQVYFRKTSQQDFIFKDSEILTVKAGLFRGLVTKGAASRSGWNRRVAGIETLATPHEKL